MNKPITNLEVLNLEYAVEGWTWGANGRFGGAVELVRDDRAMHVFADGNGNIEHRCKLGESGRIPARVAIAVGCAHRGEPTPWRLAERLDELADEADIASTELPNGSTHTAGYGCGLERAAEMARGEQ